MAEGSGSDSSWNAVVAALPDLWGWWRLDETAATSASAADSSGNSRHGVYTGSGTQSSGLFAGSTTAQNTVGSRISLPSFPIVTNPSFTLGAFIRTTAGDIEQQILSADENVNGIRMFQFRKSSSAHSIEFVTIVPSVTVTTGSTAINDGQPHLVIATFDQSLDAADGRVKLFVDGVLDGQSSTSITISSNAGTYPALGSRNNARNAGLWSGALDEGFICASAITASKVAELWNARNN